MTLLKRIGYYLAGFSAGLIILAIFLKKKKTEFCYGIDCRILKNIRSKNIVYSDIAEKSLSDYALDTVTINYILHKGDVDMSRSNTKLDSCKIYVVEGKHKESFVFLTIENCNKTATIKTITNQ